MKERYGIAYIPVVSMTSCTSSNIGGGLVDVYAKPYGFGEDLTDQTPEQERDARQAQELDSKAIHKDWDRVAAPLRKVHLYPSGFRATAAVRSLGLKKPALAIYQTLHRQAYVDTLRLHPGARATADNIEGCSGELAMALALLLAASQAPQRLVIATGRLGGQPAGTRPEDPDVEVLSVGKLPEKLRLVERLAIDRELPRGRDHADPVWLFTPATFDHGGEPVAVETLPEVARLKAVGVTVIPVKTLDEAAGHLKARRARWMWQDRAGLGGMACLFLVASAVVYERSSATRLPPAPKNPLKLEITVGDRDRWQDHKPLRDVRLVYPGQTMGLTFSPHGGEYRYLLKLYSDGKADIEDIEANFKSGGRWETSPPNEGFIEVKDDQQSSAPAVPVNYSTSPSYWTFILLVSDRPWGEIQRQNLASHISSALNSTIELPSGIQYIFQADGCKPLFITPDSGAQGPYSFKGPVAESVPPPPGATCKDWAHQLLKIVKEQAKGQVRLTGYAFKVAPY